MAYDKNEVLCSFKRWQSVLDGYSMPTWQQLPQLDLYMDQVIVLINQYMQVFNLVGEGEKLLTPSMINNYVKLKIMPAPVKKRYSKVHIAYLLMISSLKQSLSISLIQKIIPVDVSEEFVRRIYETFSSNIRTAFCDTAEMIIKKYMPRVEASDCSEECMGNFVMQSALFSGALRLLVEKALELDVISAAVQEKKPNKKSAKSAEKQGI